VTTLESEAEAIWAEPRQDRHRFQVGSLALLSPAFILMGVLFVVPVVYAVYLGFTNLELVGPHAQSYSFTGLANVHRMIHDPTFWKSAKLSVIFVVGSAIVGQTVLGMALALLMRRALAPIRMSVGAIVIVAWVLPEISAAFVWYAFSQSGGTLSLLLNSQNSDYLVSVPMLIVCIANTWRNTAFSMLVFSAGLKNVPAEVEEAAALEGASAWHRLVHVILPIMRPTIMTNLLLVTLGNISDFTLIFAMTQGGPGTDTSVLPVYMYIQAFQFNELGYGTAIALALIVMAAAFSALYVRQLKPELTAATE
jgi:multiple sugar transport system permease protein